MKSMTRWNKTNKKSKGKGFTHTDETATQLYAMLDRVIAKRGLKAYRYMDGDDEASSAKELRISAMLPDLRFAAGDESDEAKRQQEFIIAALDKLPGGAVKTFTSIMDNSCVLGFSVCEKHKARGDIAGFSNAFYFENIRLLRTESFMHKDGLQANDAGIIDTFVEKSGFGSEARGGLDDVFYYAHQGSTLRPRGRSVYYPAYGGWNGKSKVQILFAVFMGVNAAGVKIGKIKEEDWYNKTKREAALGILRELASKPNIVIPETMELTLDQPGAGVGGHFIDALERVYNKAIRKSILYDETMGVEGRYTASYASKEIADNVVSRTMLKLGKAYCRVIQDQIVIPLLDMNGFDRTIPPPMPLPVPAKEADGNPQEVIASLSNGFMSGLFTVGLPDNVQEEIIRRTTSSIDVDFEDLTSTEERRETTPEEPYTAPWSREQKPPAIIHAGRTPKGRSRADILAMGKEFDGEMNKGILRIQTQGKITTDSQIQALSDSLFKGDSWRSTDSTDIRIAIEKSISSGGRAMSKIIDGAVWDGWTVGKAHAQHILPQNIKAEAGSASPKHLTDEIARQLFRNKRYFKMDQVYGQMANKIYSMLIGMLDGHATAQDAIMAIGEYLEDEGFTKPGLARTIVETNFATAYSRSRQNLFSEIEDETGTVPGSISHYLYSAILDKYTTDLCRYRLHDVIWAVGDPNIVIPPAHYNCRSVLIPIFSGESFWRGRLVDRKESRRLASYVPSGFGSVS